MDSYVIKIFLYEVEPLIWRRFTVPATATFAEFNEIIQKVMGWSGGQDHQFRHGKGRHLGSVISNTQEQVGPQDDFTDEKEVVLKDFVGRRRLSLRLMYRYDFFDEWTHEVVIEEKSEADAPKVLEGERACPPEDCGGSFGYKECMGGFAEWMDDDFDPEAFDPESIKLP
ncbi:plasmid pRiA4b ORF-3 family protein [Verrucomicrobiaceae bacterium 5K15]|uniref:Plasmid pRiA4b ORF-3 family protein n=1 Tax=Oceaniferula flava TaxID=2800421 RepID=A0AAE2SCV4_9BACT|nr:plasmid pRiA4b ORF-3 family protein [Oceaniferula flavus]MBK1854185.1 plasmid pRiA4b ORF-3 family protein [Oceaniferula flavus]MBM1135491.1 plasmid pRiA4b ORF-3 family protein [Oceaniferula flavus]